MHPTRPASAPARAYVALGLVLFGLVMWGLFRFLASGDPYPYAPGARAPDAVTLHKGASYTLAMVGGRNAARAAGVNVDELQCVLNTPDGGSEILDVQRESDKATTAIGRFVSPVSARGQVVCIGLPALFVVGDDTPYDTSGLLLVLAVIALTVGAPLLLSALRRPTVRDAAAPTEEMSE